MEGNAVTKTIKQMMAVLLGNLTALLAEDSDEPLCMVTQMPGESIAFDYDCGGTAWVRLVNANPTVIFPNPDTTEQSCAATLAFQVEVGIMRPASVGEVVNNEYIPPSDVDLFNATERQLDDLQILWDTIQKSRSGIPQMVIGIYNPVGPDGGIVGGTWQLAIGGDED
jgi:hypothetical protein